MSLNICACNDNVSHQEKYGENETMEIMERFRRFYEGKLHEIDKEGGGECLELKLKVQQKWIHDLTEQTEMMAKIVRELEMEATDRVQKLEEKLRQTSKSAYEVMKRYQTFSCTHNLDEPFQKVFYLENDVKNMVEFIRRIREDNKWSIDGLQFYEIGYSDLFGMEQQPKNDQIKNFKEFELEPTKDKENTNELEQKLKRLSEETYFISEKLKIKEEECENLRQSMLDMRSALTEEVACKHDIISSLRKDVQQLEERCVQSDKQTAFKDDIIKELRKEIKQLKQQIGERRVEELQSKLHDSEQKLKIFEHENKQREKNRNDEIFSSQTDALNVKTFELQDLHKKKCCFDDALSRKDEEIDQLKCICDQLKATLSDTKDRAANLQKAVDLYLNSINVLEATEEKSKLEIEQQRMTIHNLQEALVCVKNELDEVRGSIRQDMANQEFLIHFLELNLKEFHEKNNNLQENLSNSYFKMKQLQDATFHLELEHLNCLQDLAIMETQLHKYQNEFKTNEDWKGTTKGEIKKLKQQKRCYEHVIDYFKNEMASMSEQLTNLQEILKLSNNSSKEESAQLYATVHELQELNERLKRELVETEQKVLIENHLNQYKDAQIGELQQIIGQKNVDLNMHDEAIHEMKQQLDNSTLENHELKSKIVALNSTIKQLHLAIQNKEIDNNEEKGRVENCTSALTVCQRSFSTLKDDLRKKTKKLEQLEADNQLHIEMLNAAKGELEHSKEKHKEKNRSYKMQLLKMKEELNDAEMRLKQMATEVCQFRCQGNQLAQENTNKEKELAQYKKYLMDLKQMLIELNNVGQHENECACKKEAEETDMNEIFVVCREQIALHNAFVKNLKEALIEATQKVVSLNAENKNHIEQLNQKDANLNELARLIQQKDEDLNYMNEQLRHQDVKLTEMGRQLSKRDKEKCENVGKMVEKLEKAKAEEKRLNKIIQDMKSGGVGEGKKDAEVSAVDKQEVDTLKQEIQKMIQNQCSLNSENDKLLNQITRFQAIIAKQEEMVHVFRGKLEQAIAEMALLKEGNVKLTRLKDRRELELQSLQVAYAKLEKSLQQANEELQEARINRDDVCSESRHVVNNVKSWLDEQRKINDSVKKKAQCYCDAIEKLKKENAGGPAMKQPRNQKNTYRVSSPEFNGWTLGSQGTGSLNDRDSPNSIMSCSVDEWYSSNYRDDDETDGNNDDFLERIEALTNRMKESNKKWKGSGKCAAKCSKERDGT